MDLSANDHNLEELRELLLAPEWKEIARLEELAQRPPSLEDYSQALPEAIKHRLALDQELDKALEPTISQILNQSFQENPQAFAEALFPLLGPAIKKMVLHTFRQMTQSVNQALNQNFNPWLRYQAFKAGVSYSHYLLLHQLVYRVEQIFFIEKESGILLDHVYHPEVEIRDPDLIGAMLTAINDFATDSLSSGEEQEEGGVEHLTFGELSLLTSISSSATLTLVVRGQVPPDLEEKTDALLERLLYRNRDLLDNFKGDTQAFKPITTPMLEELLLGKESEEEQKLSFPFKVVIFLVLSALIWFGADQLVRSYRFHSFYKELQETPGIVIAQANRGFYSSEIIGLKDPLASDPQAIAQKHLIDNCDYHWQEFYSSDRDIISQRFLKAAAPPKEVQISWDKETLKARGYADEAWKNRALLLASHLPGVPRYDDSQILPADPVTRIRKITSAPPEIQLTQQGNTIIATGGATTEWIENAQKRIAEKESQYQLDTTTLTNLDQVRWQKLQQKMESYSLYFEIGTSNLQPQSQQKIAKIVATWEELLKSSKIVQKSPSLIITGQSDNVGDPQSNKALCLKRASIVQDLLIKKGVDKASLGLDGVLSPNEDPRLRRVIFFVRH